jgi:iron complex transport system substrate-binding protein
MARRRARRSWGSVRSSRALLALAAALGAASCAPPPAAPPPGPPAPPRRVVSLDYCADQFVLKLADRDQIAGLSPDAGKDFSFMRGAAAGLPQVRSTGEDVLAARPDLVVRSYGGGPGVEHLLARAGVGVAQLGHAGDFAGVRANVRAMALALGHPARGEALIAQMDARLAAIAARPPSGLEALYVTPGGVTTGAGSLVHVLIEAAGLENFERQPGWRPIPLERLAGERPDLIALGLFGAAGHQPDAWSPMRHPIAQRQMAQQPVAAVEGAWTACGGWFLVEAVEALAEGAAHAPPDARAP